MVKIGTAILVLVCVPAVCALQVKGADMPDEQQQVIEKAIPAVHAQMQQAAQSRDVDSLYSYVLDTSGGPIIEDGRLMRTRQEAMESTKRGFEAIKNVSYFYAYKHVTAISPTAALWVGQGTARASLEDSCEISAPFAETIVFVLTDGQWKVLHAHRSAPNRSAGQ